MAYTINLSDKQLKFVRTQIFMVMNSLQDKLAMGSMTESMTLTTVKDIRELNAVWSALVDAKEIK